MKPLTRTALLSACALAGPAAVATPVLAVSGQEVLETACAACHIQHPDGRWERIDAVRKTPEGWDMTVTRMMRNHGVALEPDERIAKPARTCRAGCASASPSPARCCAPPRC